MRDCYNPISRGQDKTVNRGQADGEEKYTVGSGKGRISGPRNHEMYFKIALTGAGEGGKVRPGYVVANQSRVGFTAQRVSRTDVSRLSDRQMIVSWMSLSSVPVSVKDYGSQVTGAIIAGGCRWKKKSKHKAANIQYLHQSVHDEI